MSIGDIYIIGSSGHAKVIVEAIESDGKYNVVGYIDDFKEKGISVLGYNVIGSLSDLIDISKKKNVNVVVAVGESKNREFLVKKLEHINISYPNIIHPSAVISKRALISEGTIILANAIVSASSSIGKHCLINHGVCVDHDTILDDFVTLCPNVFIAGNVFIGKGAIIGIGTNVINNVKIGEGTYIGAGSCVISDQAEHIISFGNPSKYIKKNKKENKFFK